VVDRLLPGFGVGYRISRAMRQLVSSLRLDVVEFPNWEGVGTVFQATRRVPSVVRLHTSSRETHEIDGGKVSRLRRWDFRWEKWLALGADTLVTHSNAHRARMAKELGVDEGRISVVPHGVPVYPGFQRRTESNNERLVVYVGRLEKRKGTLDLMRAIPSVLRAIGATRFVFIGGDRPHCPGGRTHAEFIREELPSEARERIQLLGRLPDDEVNRWLQTADLFVAPSVYESFGLVFLEAMRWGTPVIGARAGGVPEIVDDGRTGFLASPGNPAELARLIVTVLGNEQLRRQIGEAGRCRVETQFSINVTAAKVAELYLRTQLQWRHARKPLPWTISSFRSLSRRTTTPAT
jgi:glycosyltransferase involved in cell wall biosynthesis